MNGCTDPSKIIKKGTQNNDNQNLLNFDNNKVCLKKESIDPKHLKHNVVEVTYKKVESSSTARKHSDKTGHEELRNRLNLKLRERKSIFQELIQKKKVLDIKNADFGDKGSNRHVNSKSIRITDQGHSHVSNKAVIRPHVAVQDVGIINPEKISFSNNVNISPKSRQQKKAKIKKERRAIAMNLLKTVAEIEGLQNDRTNNKLNNKTLRD